MRDISARELKGHNILAVYHLWDQSCQCLQDFRGQPEPAGCPHL